jgi:hypothetical protein
VKPEPRKLIKHPIIGLDMTAIPEYATTMKPKEWLLPILLLTLLLATSGSLGAGDDCTTGSGGGYPNGCSEADVSCFFAICVYITCTDNSNCMYDWSSSCNWFGCTFQGGACASC